MKVAAVALTILALSSAAGGLALPDATAETRSDHVTLHVGTIDEMKTRNPLHPWAADPWTEDVLARVYEGVLLRHPESDGPMAYIAKGVDTDEDGLFEPASEYDVWEEKPGAATPLSVVAYYDFNGVRWHDGGQVTVWDLMFSYHLNAMHPRFNESLRALLCAPNVTYDACDRQVNIATAAKNWEGEGTMPGDPALRVALTFTLNEPSVRFVDKTLSPRLFPMHVWSRTGGGRHMDFGCAMWIPPEEAAVKGLSECGTPDSGKWGRGVRPTETVPGSRPFEFGTDLGALRWNPRDQDVIGHGPFRFQSWAPGNNVIVERNEFYYTGSEYDPRLNRILVGPHIEAIEFRVFKSFQVAVFALENGDVDYLRPSIPAEFTYRLQLCCYDVAFASSADPGFSYVAYNMRRAPWGFRSGNTSDDVGHLLRRAIAHLIDKKAIVQNLLQNFGVIGHGPVSPVNTFWYNDNIPKLSFDIARATAILDSPEALAAGISADPPGECHKDNEASCRSLPVIGVAEFHILTPQADYDPVQAFAGAMIAEAMRSVGLNAIARLTSFGQIPQIVLDPNRMVLERDFDLFIKEWRVEDADPDYLFALLHSSNVVSGENAPGVNNATLDRAIDESRRALNQTVRQGHVFRIQELVSDLRPVDVLYFRTRIEGYRQDRYVNWTERSGTLWNYWSLMGLRAPRATSPCHLLTVESATASGARVQIVVTVCDDQSTPLAGSTVVLSASHGTIEIGAAAGRSLTGTTDANGQLVVDFHAPLVEAETMVVLTANATHSDMGISVVRSAIIRVFSDEIQFLSLRLALPVGDHVTAGSALPMTLTVRDQGGAGVTDAKVAVETSDPTLLLPDPAAGSAEQMARVTLRAPRHPQGGEIHVFVNASKPGHRGADVIVTVRVFGDVISDPRCPNGGCPPPPVPQPVWIPLVIFAAAGSAVVVTFVWFPKLRRRTKDR